MRMNKSLVRLAALLLTLSMLVTGALAAEPVAMQAAAQDTTAFGSAAALTTAAWTNDALGETACKALVNAETLHPQKTGWVELDAVMEQLLAPYRDKDTYTQLKGAYDWLVKKVTYSWNGYSKTTAPAYEYFTELNYLTSLTYEEGLQKSIPDDMANRTYHILTQKKGVCYDYAIAFAVIARYIGIESYVHTGYFSFETTAGSGHHGWSILVLGGQSYVFDPQRDARNWEYNTHNGYYFGIPADKASRYFPNYAAADRKNNPERDASMLSMTADRAHMVTITATASGSGTVAGAGRYITGNTATLTATAADGWHFQGWYTAEGSCASNAESYPFTVAQDAALTARFLPTVTLRSSRSGSASATEGEDGTLQLTAESENADFEGWYDTNGQLISEENPLALAPEKPVTMIAMFTGDRFYDISENAWYLKYAMQANELGIIKGETHITFAGEDKVTRAMAIAMIARMDGSDLSGYTEMPFADVPAGSYYYRSAAWGAENGVIMGFSASEYGPERPVTREQLMAMLTRYLKHLGYELAPEATELKFTDSNLISPYARNAVAAMTGLGLVSGYEDESVRPGATITRAEAAALMVRVKNYTDSNPLPNSNP